MYGGRPMEYGPAAEVFNAPQHPYAWGLLESMPTVERRMQALIPIEGSPPSLLDPPSGCPFNPRCTYRFEPCDRDAPHLEQLAGGHLDSCFLAPERKREEWERRSAAAALGAAL
jgi:peptide/nickel transport system ATP-binding protein